MMELDEIKSAWTAMDERLKKNEGLNERLIKEILMQKSSKSLKKLYNYEMFGTITMLIVLPILIYIFTQFKQSTLHQFMTYPALGIFFIGMISQLYKLILLFKIDLQKKVKENIAIIQRYNVYIKMETIIGIIVTSIFLLGTIIGVLLLQYKMETWRWAGIIVSIFGIFPLGVYWQYKKVYKANIQSILNSLEELKDLEE